MRRFEGHTGEIRRLTVSPDGRQLLTASWDKTLRLWDVASGRELLRWEGHSERVHSAAFLPDGSRALSCGNDDKNVSLWDLKDAHRIRSYLGHAKGLSHVAVCADGHLAVSCGYESTVLVWEVETGQELRRLQGTRGVVETVALSKDGRQVLTGTIQGSIGLWDVEKGVEVSRLEGHSGIIMGLAISPDGQFAISCGADKTVRLWQVATGREVRRFQGHALSINAVAFSPDGRRLLTGSVDTTMRLWDIETGKQLYLFEGHKGHLWTVAFSPDGRYAYSAGQDKVVRMWRLPPAGFLPPPPKDSWPAGVVVEGNLLRNGSFEEGPDPGADRKTYQRGSTGIPCWTVSRGSIDVNGTLWKSSHGQRSLDLDGEEPGGIRQTFATVAGRRYRVTFDLAGNPDFKEKEPAVKRLRVRAAGQYANFEFDMSATTRENMGWVGKRWEFTASGPGTILEFESLSARGGCGAALDNVAVVPVTDPNGK
jgi:choice-of-anchor C domain-containing protein